MKHYELLCVLPGTLAEDELPPAIEKVKDIITAEGGENILVEDKGKNRLTYPMKHIRYGYFFLLFFEAEPDIVATIQKKLNMTKEFLRILINAHDPEAKKKYSDALDAIEKRRVQYGGKEKEQAAVEQTVREEKKKVEPVKKKEEKKEKKVDMEEITEKLDALLQSDLEKV